MWGAAAAKWPGPPLSISRWLPEQDVQDAICQCSVWGLEQFHDVSPPVLVDALGMAPSPEALDAVVRADAAFADTAEWVILRDMHNRAIVRDIARSRGSPLFIFGNLSRRRLCLTRQEFRMSIDI